MILKTVNKIYSQLLSEKRKRQFEKIIFPIAIVAFVVHFMLIVLGNLNLFSGISESENPVKAIYTPFSIILLYEIYLLIYYLPKSITIYLGKQYEIIALILIRKTFDDLANLSVLGRVIKMGDIQNLLLTFGGLIILFLLIFCFYKLSGSKADRVDDCDGQDKRNFLSVKEILALGLLAFFVFLFIRSLFDLRDLPLTINHAVYAIKTINQTFFSTFFTALILTEVLLLLFTFNLSDKFSKIIRNSGFIISTILLKLSFMVEGLMNVVIILVAVVFGLAVMGIYRLFEKNL